MPDLGPGWVAGLVALVAGSTVLGLWLGAQRERARRRREIEAGRDEAARILDRAKAESESTLRNAELAGREEAFRARSEWEREESRRREEVDRTERRLDDRGEGLDRRAEQLDGRETELEERSRGLTRLENELQAMGERVAALRDELRTGLAAVAGMSTEEARKRLVDDLIDEARAEAANTLRAIEEEAQRTAEREAKKVLTLTIQRLAVEQTAEMTVSVVQLPSDEMKGRIIGREGRNIRAFEQATGIDVIIDDTPEAVVLSGFDPVRREIARIALERLIDDGRIHPGRIEQVVEKAREEVGESMVRSAEELLYELGIHNVHAEIVRTLGRLRFRTSYGQNQLQHAREVALLAGGMAAELGLDVQQAKRAGVLHDVGKGLTHEQEGTHVELGYRLCKKHGESEIVLNAIRAHHDEEPHHFPETFLVTASDAISGSRPGARREMFEGYVKRLERLEEIATEEDGVERCFAIQAGRELRIMVQPEKVTDQQMAQISERVARRIEGELQYPGQIKIVVVRETRAVDFAR